MWSPNGGAQIVEPNLAPCTGQIMGPNCGAQIVEPKCDAKMCAQVRAQLGSPNWSPNCGAQFGPMHWPLYDRSPSPDLTGSRHAFGECLGELLGSRDQRANGGGAGRT